MKEQLKAAALTFVKTALVAALGIIVAWGPDVLDKSVNDWKLVLAVTVAALAKVAYNALNQNDPRYGLTS